MKTFYIVLIVLLTCTFFSCKPPELPVANYQLTSDNELANDTIDHALTYTFKVINSLTSAVESGNWELQLLKKDGTYYPVVREDNRSSLFIPAGSLIDKIPTNQLFEYDGLRIKGRVLFQKNKDKESIELDRMFTVWGKPVISDFRVTSMKENGYPDEMDVKLEFIHYGATDVSLYYKNEVNKEYINFIIESDTYNETFDNLDMTTVNELQLIATNFLGSTYSEKIYIGGK